jgi:adenylate cyclase
MATLVPESAEQDHEAAVDRMKRVSFAGFILDIGGHTLSASGGRDIPLRRSEFDLLACFVRSPGRVLSRDHLLNAVAGRLSTSFDRSVDVLVSRLRHKIEADAKMPSLIVTVPGTGYKFTGRPFALSSGSAHTPAMVVDATNGKPRVAVLAFDNMSDDCDQEYFSDGIADDITTELAGNRSLFVIARNSSFTYKGRAVDVNQIGNELGVRYVLRGSVRRDAMRARVNAQLIDAESNVEIWAEHYDRDLIDIFAVQSEIATAVTVAITPAVANAELRRILRKRPESLGAWEAYQRGLWYMAKYNAVDNEQAIEILHRAIAQDQTFVAAYVSLAFAYFESGQMLATRPLDDAISLAANWACKAAEIDPQDADVQIALGCIAQLSGHMEEAAEYALSALASNPNLASGHSLKGSLMIYNGEPAEGRNTLLTALQLSPRDLRNIVRFNQVVVSHYFEADYLGTVEVARRTIARYPIASYPDNPSPYRWLAAALGQLGRVKEAREALQTVMATAPDAFNHFVRNRRAWIRPEDHEHFLDGLRKTGWRS